MAIDFVFVASVLSLILMALGFWIRDWMLIVASSFGMLAIGVHVLSYGTVGIINTTTLAIGIIFVCFGFYVFMRSTLEKIEEWSG